MKSKYLGISVNIYDPLINFNTNNLQNIKSLKVIISNSKKCPEIK